MSKFIDLSNHRVNVTSGDRAGQRLGGAFFEAVGYDPFDKGAGDARIDPG